MKFLFIAPRFHTNLYYQIQALQEAGHEVRVLALYQGKSEYKEKINFDVLGYPKVYLFLEKIFKKFKKNPLKSSWELKLGFAPFFKLKKEIQDFNPDLTFVKAYQDLLSFEILFLARWLKKKVIILTLTKKNHIKGSIFLLKLYFWFLNRLNLVAFVSPIDITIDCLNEIGIKNVYKFPFVFPLINYKKIFFREGKINILSVGKFVRRKDQMLLLKVINSLKDRFLIFLHLIGEIADKEYRNEILEYIEKDNLRENIKINYDLPYEKMQKEYQESDLFVLPSYQEPAGYVVIEALANKLPTICANDCGNRCYIEEGKNGYIFQAKNAQDLADKIEKIVSDRENLISMSRRSFELARENHSKESFLGRFKGILRSSL